MPPARHDPPPPAAPAFDFGFDAEEFDVKEGDPTLRLAFDVGGDKPPPATPRPRPNIFRMPLIIGGVSRDCLVVPPPPPALVLRTNPLTFATSVLLLTCRSMALSKNDMSASPLPYSLLVTKSSNI